MMFQRIRQMVCAFSGHVGNKFDAPFGPWHCRRCGEYLGRGAWPPTTRPCPPAPPPPRRPVNPTLEGFEDYVRTIYYGRYKTTNARDEVLMRNTAVLKDALRDYRQWLEAVEKHA